MSGGSITSSDADPLSELRVQDTVTQLERGEGLGDERKLDSEQIQTALFIIGPTVWFYIWFYTSFKTSFSYRGAV